MNRLKRIGRIGVAGGAAILVCFTLSVGFCRLDKTHVFHQVRGTYRDARIVEAWQTDFSTVRLIELRNHSGQGVVQAYVRRPLELAADSRVILTYAGAKTGRKILDLIAERPDLVLVSIQYPYEPARNPLEYLRWPYDVRRAAFRTVAGGMLAVSFLSEDEGLDLDRLTVIGSSLGSAFATIHGALDPRVPTVVLIHGGGDLPAAVRMNVGQRWLAAPAAWAAEIIVDSFDPLHYVDRIAPRKLLMISTRHDAYYPLESIEQLYERAKEPKQIVWTDTGHVRSRKTELVTEIVEQVEQYLASQEQGSRARRSVIDSRSGAR